MANESRSRVLGTRGAGFVGRRVAAPRAEGYEVAVAGLGAYPGAGLRSVTGDPCPGA